ncbi:MAG: hypothetical protein NDJ90_11655 [Oligoflexia bacterium]|nr:hypothetical protein [Oligoflexia bacterium]
MMKASISNGLSGTLIGLGPLLLVFAFAEIAQSWTQFAWASAFACLAISLSGFLLELIPRLSRTMGVLGTAALLGILFPHITESPTLALLWMIITVILLGILFDVSSVKTLVLSRAGKSLPVLSSFRILAWLSFVTWFSATVTSVGHLYGDKLWLASLISTGFCLLFSLRWLLSERRNQLVNIAWLSLSLFLMIGSALALKQNPRFLATTWLLFPASVLILAKEEHEDIAGSLGEMLLEHPARLLLLTFFGLCIGGSFLLSLPAVATGTGTITYIDAAFTAVSAVCVTGLTVLDTPRAFSGFGQFSILLLIQVGGLGIMTFYTAAFALFRRRFSIRHERAMLQVVGEERRGEVLKALKTMLKVTFVTEVFGALALTALFAQAGETPRDALWQGVFTAISAFCNAGFALKTDSLIPFQSNIPILLTVSLLIIAGGLSPMAVVTLPDVFKKKPIPLQTRLIVWTTLFLLIAGTFGFAAFEWANTLEGLSFGDKLSNAWFQSVTARTAGFNSVDIAALTPTGSVLMMILMFIGGSPGGTAGGIKVTTFALLLMATVGIFRGSPRIHLFGRHVSHVSVYRSIAVLVTSLSAGGLTLFFLFLTQEIRPGILLFEVISALGTVGLSQGATVRLDSIGKLIIMVCMLFGRVGPLTVLLSLASVRPDRAAWLPKEDVTVG